MSDIFEQMIAQHTIAGDNDRNLDFAAEAALALPLSL